jgi:hypothetical protein
MGCLFLNITVFNDYRRKDNPTAMYWFAFYLLRDGQSLTSITWKIFKLMVPSSHHSRMVNVSSRKWENMKQTKDEEESKCSITYTN